MPTFLKIKPNTTDNYIMTAFTQLFTKPSLEVSKPEIELLLCCTRTHIEPEIKERIGILLKENLNWTYLTQTAARHGVIPLFYQSLNRTYPEAVPQDFLNQLQNYVHNNAIRNLFLTTELLKLLKLFEQQNISVIPFKGPILAVSVYDNLALRQFCDIDILVHQKDINKAQELLIAQGYHLDSEYKWEQKFVNKDRKVDVDLHWEITPEYFPFILNFEELWQRVKPLPIAGTTPVQFSPEDLLIILVLQIGKDAWENRIQLLKLCDIAELLRTHPSFDWQKEMEKANKYSLERLLFLALFLVSELLGITLPPEVKQKVYSERVVRLYAKQVQKQLFSETNNNHEVKESFEIFLERLMIEKATYRNPYTSSLMWQFFHLALTPTKEDRIFLFLPAYLEFIYYFIRPIRLGVKHILRGFG